MRLEVSAKPDGAIAIFIEGPTFEAATSFAHAVAFALSAMGAIDEPIVGRAGLRGENRVVFGHCVDGLLGVDMYRRIADAACITADRITRAADKLRDGARFCVCPMAPMVSEKHRIAKQN